MKQHKESRRIRWPHFIDHDDKTVSVHVNGWISALGASTVVKKYYPGYRCELVSEERLLEVQKRN